jgi:transposase
MSRGLSLRPPRAKTGRPRVEDHKVLHGILDVRVAGCRWCDRPRPYGADPTAWRRFRELQEKGVWGKILPALLDWGYTLGKGKVEAVAVDSTRVEAKKGGKGVCQEDRWVHRDGRGWAIGQTSQPCIPNDGGQVIGVYHPTEGQLLG